MNLLYAIGILAVIGAAWWIGQVFRGDAVPRDARRYAWCAYCAGWSVGGVSAAVIIMLLESLAKEILE